MASKTLLLDLLAQAERDEAAFVEALSKAQRLAEGKENDWAAKDEIAHTVTWIDRFVERLNTPPAEVPAEPIDEISSENAVIFEAHRSESLDDVLAYAGRVRAALRAKVEAISEQELNESTQWPWLEGALLWRRVAGNAYTHPLVHYAAFLTRHDQAALATRMQEAGFRRLMEIDDSPAWRGTNLYNLACQHALNGDKEQALALLTEALDLQPQLRAWSTQDTDLVSLHEDPAFLALVD